MSKRKNLMLVIFLTCIELLQSQSPRFISNRQALCESSINDQELSSYLENVSRTARINTNDLDKIRKIISDFLHYTKDCAETQSKNKEKKTQKTTLQGKLKNLGKNEPHSPP